MHWSGARERAWVTGKPGGYQAMIDDLLWTGKKGWTIRAEASEPGLPMALEGY